MCVGFIEFIRYTFTCRFVCCISSRCVCGQIVMRDGRCVGLGIVEFQQAQQAEDTWEKLRNLKIEGRELTLTFCIPGKPAIAINNRVVQFLVRC